MASDICLRSVLDAVESAIVVVDGSGMIVASNARADRLLGKGEPLPGSPFMESVKSHLVPHLHDPRPFYEWLEIVNSGFGLSLTSSPDNRSCEVTYHEDGERSLLVSACPTESSDGQRTGMLYAFHDTTESRLAEKILEAVSDAARQINSDLQVKEMLPSLFEVVSQRVPLDGMARGPGSRACRQAHPISMSPLPAAAAAAAGQRRAWRGVAHSAGERRDPMGISFDSAWMRDPKSEPQM